jgi:hypothetical protein
MPLLPILKGPGHEINKGLLDQIYSLHNVYMSYRVNILGCQFEENYKYTDFACFYENTYRQTPIFRHPFFRKHAFL